MSNLKKEEFKNYKILVVGDDGIDRFVYGTAVRLAPEAPVPVLNPITETTNKGMAGNVVENLKSLGFNTYFIKNPEIILKTRYVDDRSDNKWEGNDIDAIIISDYDKGFLDEADIQFICENNKNVFIDTKKILGKWCVNASFIKINHVEYQHTEYTIYELGIEDKMIITLSSKGCQHKGKIYPVEKVQIRDVSGAGDTFLSGLVAEYVLTNDIEKAIPFAQQCATIVVQKPGVSTI